MRIVLLLMLVLSSLSHADQSDPEERDFGLFSKRWPLRALTGVANLETNSNSIVGSSNYEYYSGVMSFGRFGREKRDFQLAGSKVSLGAFGGSGHVLCENSWITAKMKWVLTDESGFIILGTDEENGSADPTNAKGMVYCNEPNGYSGQLRVIAAAGAYKCARGATQLSVKGAGLPAAETYYLDGIKLSEGGGISATFIVHGMYAGEDGQFSEGSIEIPRDC